MYDLLEVMATAGLVATLDGFGYSRYVDLSVVIPSYARPNQLRRCLEALAEQRSDAVWEVIVGLDGDAATTPDPTLPTQLVSKTKVIRFPKSGYIAIRSRVLAVAEGRTVLWMNDDAYAHSGLLDAHIAAAGDSTVGAGLSVWRPVDDPSLFDRMVQETDLIFFQRTTTHPKVVGFRDCYGLNMSFNRQAAIDAGGIPELVEVYGYDDIELAHRLCSAGGSVTRVHEAVVTHDHRHTPEMVVRREYELGRCASQYANASPPFARDLFGRDILDESYLGYVESVLEHERKDANRIELSMLDWASMPSDAVNAAVLEKLAEHWIPLKRYVWKWGLLDGARGVAARWSPLSKAGPLPGDVH